jgi:exonuclease SbcC
VEEYNLAARNLLPLKNLVERRVEAMENEKKFLEGRADKLVPLKEERNRLEAEDKDLARLAEEKKKLLDEARVRKEALDSIEKALRDLEGRQQVVAAEHASAIREHGRARAQLEAAEAALLRQKECEPGFKAYLAKLEEKEGLEKKRHEKEELQNAINVIHTKLTELKTRDAAGDRTLAEVTQAERELPALEQKTTEQERLEEEKAKIAALVSAKETELAQVRERMSRAKGSQGNMCPVLLDVECSSVKDFSDYFAGQVRRIESERADLKRKVEENAFKVKGLGNPRLELAVKRETLKKRDKALAEKADIVREMDAKSAELMPLIVRLNSIGPVAKAIDTINVEIKGLKPQYEAYQQNLKLAGQKDDLQRAMAQAVDILAQADKKLKEIAAAREEKAESYDRDSHEKAKVACDTLAREMASLAARNEANGRRIIDIGKEIVRIEQDLAKIEQIKRDQEAEREYLRFIDQSRTILKAAGPEIVKVYIDYISREATNMYCEIAGDRRVELRWTPDYDIILIADGREHGFRQLSGGEQMSAALAVRLAILKILTSSDVVFLDEPTQNMDEQRRSNLAQEILRIKGFRQMVVISHDDTFNSNLENVVEIEKVNGESCVRGRNIAGP